MTIQASQTDDTLMINYSDQNTTAQQTTTNKLPTHETPPVSPGGISGSSVFKLSISQQEISMAEFSFQEPKLKSNFWLPPTPPNGTHQDTNSEKLHSNPSSSVVAFSNSQSSEVYSPEHNFSVVSSNISAKPIMYHHTSVIPTMPPRHHYDQLIPTDGHLSLAEKRELARKIAHSAIERRRRERINDKIVKLQQLVPSCADQPQIHKLTILQSAIDYIGYLQGLLAEKRKRENNSNNNNKETSILDERRFAKRAKLDTYDNDDTLPESRSTLQSSHYHQNFNSLFHHVETMNSSAPHRTTDANTAQFQQISDMNNTSSSGISSSTLPPLIIPSINKKMSISSTSPTKDSSILVDKTEAKSSAKVNIGKIVAAKRMSVKRQFCGCPHRPEENIVVINQPSRRPHRPKAKRRRGKGKGKGNVQQPISAEAKSSAKIDTGKAAKRLPKRAVEEKRHFCGYPTPEPEENVIIVTQPPCPGPSRPHPKAKAKAQQPISAEAKSSAKVNIGKAKGKKRNSQETDAENEF
ncbi:1248_t:CDS:2 [Ambispora gerdemannii]|uniref:1248_t:CDS:1 n=1 Tax=Ambispora gerdemannii TaxID=144530 RepID=A0A9N9ASN6_9GLOM|nr:1248_t:CDS:2 [Ambispora gerdemannii]